MLLHGKIDGVFWKPFSLSEPGFDPGTCGLWAHHASAAPLWFYVSESVSYYITNKFLFNQPMWDASAFAPAPDLPPVQNRAVAVCLFIYLWV